MSVEPLLVRSERRRVIKSMQQVVVKKAKVPDTPCGRCRWHGGLQLHLDRVLRQFVDVVLGLDTPLNFGEDPVEILMKPVMSTPIKDTQTPAAIGTELLAEELVMDRSELACIARAVDHLGGQGLAAFWDVQFALSVACYLSLVREGVQHNDLPLPGLPNEVDAVVQDAARCAAYEEAARRARTLNPADTMSFRQFCIYANEYALRFWARWWAHADLAAYGQH